MIEYKGADISDLFFQKILEEQPTTDRILSRKDFTPTEEEVLKNIFLKPFTKVTTTYQFKHDIDLDLNVLYNLAREIFSEDQIGDTHKGITTHLRASSTHPNIKEGDLFIILFRNIPFEKNFVDGLGIYKIERKHPFLETSNEKPELELHFKEGIGEKKLDKACLILFDKEPYTVLTIDNGSREAEYWNEFTNIDFKKDNINDTNHFLQMTKSYITDQLPNEFEVSKTDQIDLLNKSIKYFKENEEFEQGTFEEQVFEDPSAIESFRKFDTEYQEENDLERSDNFKIAVNSVKKQARIFKSILKLDKNFHVYIHGDRELIEQGTEPDGRKFYKIYYEQET